MFVKTLQDQLQAEGLSMRAHYANKRYICVIENFNGKPVAVASEKQLESAATVALDKVSLVYTDVDTEPTEIVLN